MEKLRIMSVFGTRPEAIKMCPLVQELANREGSRASAASPPSTGRCWTACWSLSGEAGLGSGHHDPPADAVHHHQQVPHRHGRGHRRLKPDMILVHGDTSTTFAGACQPFTIRCPLGT